MMQCEIETNLKRKTKVSCSGWPLGKRTVRAEKERENSLLIE